MSNGRRDYYVHDEFAVIWNDEPLPTFSQANQFRGMIAKDLFPRTLKIMSLARGGYEEPQAKPAKPVMAKKENWGKDLDF